jgi:7,8-dihydropterin-6-yl-methyl-4-(beta-D-ribofuranosyl)aminobenzene 5'-phosphate synthase
MNAHNSFEVSVLFDNKCVNKGFRTGFGFSALIHNNFNGNYVLFDTGGNSGVLTHNIKKLGIKPSQISKVILSHNHYDHTGGLSGFYEKNPDIELFVPNALKRYEQKFPEAEVLLYSELREIDDSLFVSGQFGTSIKEQAVFCKTREGRFVILVGCTHPGLENFIIKARELGDIVAVIGGFHGFRKYSYLKDIDFIGACHCTQHVGAIRQKYPEQYQKVCVGDTFSF